MGASRAVFLSGSAGFNDDASRPYTEGMPSRFAEMDSSHKLILLAAFIVLVTLGCYIRVLGFDFVNYDDNKYIQMNPVVREGLTIDGTAWAFSTFRLANWHPVTWLSHMLDVEIFGLDARMHHLTNALLHAVNAALLLLLLWRMTSDIWRSALVASLFALHPLHVESVAWISERKDLLSTFFGFLAMLAYVRWTHLRQAEDSARVRSTYLQTMLFFALSLMCKPMLVTLPFVLLLLDFWPLNRIAGGRFRRAVPPNPSRTTHQRSVAQLIIEKLPLLALSAASCVITVIAQWRGGAVAGLEALPFEARVATAVVAYGMYLRQMIWPADLSPLYPLPESWPNSTIFISAIVLLMITVASLFAARRRPAILVGWLWYLGTLVPVIGLVQVGSQAHADRYTYVPLIGLFVMVAWAIPDFAPSRRTSIAMRDCAIAAVLVCCAALTWRQLGHWRNSVTLSQHAIAVTPNNAVAHFNLANAFTARNKVPEAIEQLQIAATINPRWADVHFNLGNALARAKDPDAAIQAYRQALSVRPDYPAALNNLGTELAKKGERDAALDAYEHALAVDPSFADALSNLGDLLASSGRLEESAARLNEALQLRPDDALTHIRMGTTLARLNRLDEARDHFHTAVSLDPNNALGEMYLATSLRDAGNADRAATHFSRAAQLARAQGNQALFQEIMRRSVQTQPPASAPAPDR